MARRLERKRLDLVNKEKTLAADAVNRELLASLVVVEMEVSRAPKGKGVRTTVVLRDNAGAILHRIVHEVDEPTGEGMLAPLSAKIQEALKTTAPNAQANRNRESRRFLREAELLWKHKYYAQGWRAAEAAFALKPSEDARHLLAEYLMRYATELLHPGGSRTIVGGKFELKVTPEKLREALGLARRGMQLMEASRSPTRMHSDWVSVDLNLEPILISDARRFLFNKVPYVHVVPSDDAAQQELDEFREFSLRRIVDRCLESTRGSVPDAKILDRFTYEIQDSFTRIREIAPSRAVFTNTMHELAMKWLDLSAPLKPETISPETAAKFGEFLRSVYLPNLFPGKPAPDVPLEAFDRALKHPHPIVRLYSDHAYTRLMFTLEKLPREEAIARHQKLLVEGKKLIDEPPFPPHALNYQRFRVTIYRLLNDAIGHVYLHKKGADVVQEYLDLCDFMLARNDVIEDIVRAAVGYGSVVHEQNVKAMQIIDKALEVTDSPKRRYFADSPERFKFYMKDARRQLMARLPDVAKKSLPWESITPLVTTYRVPVSSPTVKPAPDLGKLNVTLIVACLVHDKHIYFFTGGEDPATKHRLLQLFRIPVEGGPPTLLGKTLVSVEKPPEPSRYYVFWISGDQHFVASTAVADGNLYAGTVSEGIFVFPLAGGDPKRIGEKEGLPSRTVHKLAVVDRTLIAGLEGGYIVTHDLDAGRTDVIVSSRRAEKLSPFDNSAPFRVWELAADPKRHRVLFTLNLNTRNDPREGLWEFNLKSRQFKRLQPVVYGAWGPVRDERLYIVQVDGINRLNGGLVAFDLASNQYLLIHGHAPKEYGDLKNVGMPKETSIPFPRHLLHGNHYWSAYPFGRHSLDGKHEEPLPSLHDQTFKIGFSARTILQALSPDELLIGDLSALYRVRLKGPVAESSAKPGSLPP